MFISLLFPQVSRQTQDQALTSWVCAAARNSPVRGLYTLQMRKRGVAMLAPGFGLTTAEPREMFSLESIPQDSLAAIHRPPDHWEPSIPPS